MVTSRKKIIRTSTVPSSLNGLLKGQLAFLNQYYNIIGVSGKGESLNDLREREGIRISSVEMQRHISPFKDLISLVRLYRFFKEEKPVIVHSITPKAGLLTMLAGKMARVPIRMHTFTGLVFPTKTGPMQQLLIKMDWLLCWAATHVYPEGEGVKKDLLHYKVTTKPLKVLGNGNVNGVDLEYFNPDSVSAEQKQQLRESLGIRPNDFVFVFVGRLVKDKGINELVEAFKRLQSKADYGFNDNIKLLLVGKYEQHLDPLLPSTLHEIENNAGIITAGSQKDVRLYYAISDCLALPSYREGFPNVVLEAGAMGLPSIVTNINGSNEIIKNGINGIIITKKDFEALYEKMLYLYQSPEIRNNMALNSRKHIAEKYERKFVWNELLKEYNKALESKNL